MRCMGLMGLLIASTALATAAATVTITVQRNAQQSVLVLGSNSVDRIEAMIQAEGTTGTNLAHRWIIKTIRRELKDAAQASELQAITTSNRQALIEQHDAALTNEIENTP